MTSAQAWVVIVELGLFNVILAIIVTVTLVKGLKD